MNTNPHNPSTAETGEETLRLIASLPAPEGLEGRIEKVLRHAPLPGQVLAWPSGLRAQSSWMRSAAAAAIVFVVAGGGWGVYTRVLQNQPAKVIVMPPRVIAPGGFSGAGAMRTPQTLTGPTAPPAAQHKAAKKPATQPSHTAKKLPAR